MMIHPGKILVLRIRDQMPVDQLEGIVFPAREKTSSVSVCRENGACVVCMPSIAMCSFHFVQIIWDNLVNL